MSFKDVLSNPLPSKQAILDSFFEDMEDVEEIDNVGDDVNDLDDDEDDKDPDEMSDDELAELDRELSTSAIDAAAGIDDDVEQEKLTPSEELQADDMMAVAATTMLVNDELNAEERAEFIESGEGDIAVREHFLTEADLASLKESVQVYTEAKYTNKMVIRLNAASKKKQLYSLAVNVSAAAHNDPDYRLLRKIMKARKVVRRRLEQKYRAEAQQRMKVYYERLRHSKSKKLISLGKKKK